MAEANGRFWRISTAGVFFQGGAAAIDTGTIVASLVNAMTGSALAVGAAAAIARTGWLFPQFLVAYFAEGKVADGSPSLRYRTLVREGARAKGLPDHYVRYLERVRAAE